MGRMKDLAYEMLLAEDEDRIEMIAQQRQDMEDFFAYMEEVALKKQMALEEQAVKDILKLIKE